MKREVYTKSTEIETSEDGMYCSENCKHYLPPTHCGKHFCKILVGNMIVNSEGVLRLESCKRKEVKYYHVCPRCKCTFSTPMSDIEESCPRGWCDDCNWR